jgi:hypothetical protein
LFAGLFRHSNEFAPTSHDGVDQLSNTEQLSQQQAQQQAQYQQRPPTPTPTINPEATNKMIETLRNLQTAETQGSNSLKVYRTDVAPYRAGDETFTGMDMVFLGTASCAPTIDRNVQGIVLKLHGEVCADCRLALDIVTIIAIITSDRTSERLSERRETAHKHQ